MPYKDPEKQREFQRNWLRKRRDDWLADKSCVLCGSVDNLEIDHIDPSTKKLPVYDTVHKNRSNGVYQIFSWSQERRDAELSKCQVLCHDCHLEKTKIDLSNMYPHNHGTRSEYRRGCRCRDCTDAAVEYNREYRKLKKSQS